MFKTIKQRHIDTSDFYLEFTHVLFDNFIYTSIWKWLTKGIRNTITLIISPFQQITDPYRRIQKIVIFNFKKCYFFFKISSKIWEIFKLQTKQKPCRSWEVTVEVYENLCIQSITSKVVIF